MKIKTILTNDELKDILNLLKKVSFESGKKTAAGLTKNLKNNLEACVNDENYLKLSKILKSKIIKNKWLRTRYLPKKMNHAILNKFLPGDSYGKHFDASHMNESLEINRNDFSFTLMLSQAADYEGGELEIQQDNITHKVKLDAGDMVIYPSIYIHKVLPVTKGERIAFIGWIGSHIKDRYSHETLNAYEDMHIALSKYDLSEEDHLLLGYVKNRLRHILSD
ncbi:Fe2+-dependent dioxygenase [Gammaproteobacteria bacterium]|nr:Fe2+-dependent dioxygenase [Gammaproteobacteria bacterium]|tara:strand:+ start:492 stop:1157 length:666 start_codon:yes stop_codon:yes gene_type:complete